MWERDPEVVARLVVDAAVRVHRRLGPGLLESVYQAELVRELRRRGCRVEQKKHVAFEVDGVVYTRGLRPDLVVDGVVVVELKAVEVLAPVHFRQALTYLRLLDLPIGLLINFGAATLAGGGIRRILNNYRPRVDFRRHGNRPGDRPELTPKHEEDEGNECRDEPRNRE